MGSHIVVRPYAYPAEIGPGVTLDSALGHFLADEAAELNRDFAGSLELWRELREGTALTLVAHDGRNIAGFVALKRGASDARSHVADLRIHVGREYRANGVGHKLLRRALFWADRKGIERIIATPYVTSWKDTGKLAFFFRHGFLSEGYAEKFARLLDGGYANAALLARLRHS